MISPNLYHITNFYIIFYSAIKCPNCIIGCILPIHSLDYNSTWACQLTEHGEKGCGHEMTKEAVEALVDEIEEELNEINTSGEFQYYSDFIQRYSDIYLHRNHYLIMTAARFVFTTLTIEFNFYKNKLNRNALIPISGILVFHVKMNIPKTNIAIFLFLVENLASG